MVNKKDPAGRARCLRVCGDVHPDGDEEDGGEREEEDGVDEDGGAAGLEVAELHEAAALGRQLQQQARRQQHEQHHRHHHGPPVRHPLRLVPCRPCCLKRMMQAGERGGRAGAGAGARQRGDYKGRGGIADH